MAWPMTANRQQAKRRRSTPSSTKRRKKKSIPRWLVNTTQAPSKSPQGMASGTGVQTARWRERGIIPRLRTRSASFS